ncbi:MAG: PHP domain-containing protein [Gemmatimonadetes bacterium]|nr:MAG: PHP domain-containing protein [Gemmatimonadota bacterium]
MKLFQKSKTIPPRADLHMHSVFSDGKSTPSELVDLAKAHHLTAIAITDHDVMDAYPDICEYGKRQNVEVIPGVELSANYQEKDVHILGYFVDPEHPELKATMRHCRESRHERAKQMVEKLNQQNVNISFDRVAEIAGEGAIGRPHIAQALLESGYVYEWQEAFHRFIGYHNEAYVAKAGLSPAEAFRLIHDAGGIAVWAHPGSIRQDKWLTEFVAQGLDGLEVHHPVHDPHRRRQYAALARKYGLIPTGGTDFHGDPQTTPAIGAISVSYDVVKQMKRRTADQ